MATCLCDAFYPDAARRTVEVLERVGCSVEFPAAQTCCGQPAFNSGDWVASRRVVRHTLDVFSGELPVVVPSGSCAAMAFHGSPLQFKGKPGADRVAQMARRTWELCDFLVNGLGVERWGGSLRARLAIHHSCHTRGSGTGAAMELLLRSIEGIEILSLSEPDQCCGFGGTFSVAFPHISSAMGRLKVKDLARGNPDFIVSADMSCLMHQSGLARREGLRFPVRHISEILADAARGARESGERT